MDYIKKHGSYFVTESGEPWTVIGHNESYMWPSLNGILNNDINSVHVYLQKMKDSGVTCLRMMIEDAHYKEGLLENPMGTFRPEIVSMWDKLFELFQSYNIRVLLSPYDTFWQWINWKEYPYNIKNGGYLENPSFMLQDPKTLQHHQDRMEFIIRRWGNSGVIFAWDLWNEIHPNYSNKTNIGVTEYITRMSKFIRELELSLYGKSHLQTCSVFLPEIEMSPDMSLKNDIFRHPDLDFCNVHMYMHGTIDDPKNTIEPAISVGKIVKECLSEIKDGRPFFDSEHGPIHSFKDKKITLSEDFDSEYYTNMAWAHLASGGAGGGMRWPNRHPHTLVEGMYNTEKSISNFSKYVNWSKFSRENLTDKVMYDNQNKAVIFSSGTNSKNLMFILRKDCLNSRGMFDQKARPITVTIAISDLIDGDYRINVWNTKQSALAIATERCTKGKLTFLASVKNSLMLYIEKI